MAAPHKDRDRPPPLRLAINAVHAKSGGGVTYLRRMLPLLAAEPGVAVHLLIHQDQTALFRPLPAGVEVTEFDYPPGFLRTLIWEQLSLPGVAQRLNADVLFSPANFGPVFARNHVVLLRNATSVIRLTRHIKPMVYWTMLSLATLASLLTAKRAIAVSDYAARVLTFGLRRFLAGKISVVFHGTHPVAQIRSANAADGTGLLAVSDIYIQKNYHTLVRAFSALHGRRPNLTLTIVGREIDARYANSIRVLVATLGLTDSVRFLGHVETDKLVELYRTCHVFVFPSTVETFGNPLLEAMAAGAPIASSNAAAMPEVIGDTGLLFDPDDADDMAQTIERLLDDPDLRVKLGAAASARSRAFTWEDTARRTLDVLRSAAGH
jgi:glycosyltransferase involved in cell wall biosynthesis